MHSGVALVALVPLVAACVGVAPATTGTGAAARALPSQRDELLVAADAPGSVQHPAAVSLVLAKGSLRVAPGSRGGHLVEGTVRSSDPTLLPHLTVNARGVALAQDFAPDEGTAPRIAWDLTLGATPVRLDVHVIGSEEQRVDLGAAAVVAARLYNEGGHLQLDWSAPNALVAERLELWSVGYLEANHLARSGARRIEVKCVGFGHLDLGDRVDRDLRIDVEAGTGALEIVIPAGVTARATVAAPTGLQVEAEGWRQEADGGLALGFPRRRSARDHRRAVGRGHPATARTHAPPPGPPPSPLSAKPWFPFSRCGGGSYSRVNLSLARRPALPGFLRALPGTTNVGGLDRHVRRFFPARRDTPSLMEVGSLPTLPCAGGGCRVGDEP